MTHSDEKTIKRRPREDYASAADRAEARLSREMDRRAARAFKRRLREA